MKRIIVPLLILLMFISHPTGGENRTMTSDIPIPVFERGGGAGMVLASSGRGLNRNASSTIMRNVTGQSLSILNDFKSPSLHSSMIDLIPYQIPGWTLYQAEVKLDNLTAAPEREVVGSTGLPSNITFLIQEYGADTYYEQLTQGFYEQPHNGSLVNYSVAYFTNAYVPANHGNLWLVVRSDYSNNTSNVTSAANIGPKASGFEWVSQNAGGENLTADTEYFAIFDGRDLHEDFAFNYPQIYWGTEVTAETYQTRRYSTEFSAWSNDLAFEALLNYTYIPWNQTSNSAMVFNNPQSILLSANSTQFTSNNLIITDTHGIQNIEIQSNQSVYMYNNLTLWYFQDTTTSTTWFVDTTGSQVQWNATMTLAFPSFPETGDFSFNISTPNDWTVSGLYNSTNPGTDYPNYLDVGENITCSLMTNGTWTLSSLAYNYLTDILAPAESSILDDINIISTIEDALSNLAETGTTNLTISHEGSTVYSPSNLSVSAGSTNYLWDINSTTSSNGTFLIEEFWTNGTEAGYRSIEIIIYYPTNLVAANSLIQTYTEGNYEIRVDFTETFGPSELTDADAVVRYSYDSGLNVSMIDQWANGTWTATVSSVGESSGAHTINVYAEGFAIENQSLTINVILTHETQSLVYAWSGPLGNNISYIESTNLTVWYKLADGTNITGATVNITDGLTTWDLIWDPVSEGYWIQFNGTYFDPVPNTFNFTTRAWKVGHEYQENSSISLIVREESDTSLSIVWTPSNLSLTYVGQLTVVANYSYGGSPILGASVRLSFNGSSYTDLIYNASTELWHLTLSAADIDLGTWNISLRANQNGYSMIVIDEFLYIVEDIPVLSGSWPSDSETTDYETPTGLNVTITDSQGTPIINSTVTVSLQGTEYNMTHLVNGIYNAILVPEKVRGFHQVVVTITEYGFETTTLTLNLTILATTDFIVEIVQQVYETEEIEIEIGFVDDEYRTSLFWGYVNLTIDGTTYYAVYDGTVFVIRFNVSLSPNFYPATILAMADGCRPLQQQITIEVLTKVQVSITINLVNAPIEGQSIGIEATVMEAVSGNVIRFATIHFEVWVNFDNGTVIYAEGEDSTNENGVALWQFTIPSGVESRVEDIDIRVIYDAPVRYWDAQATRTEPISIDPFVGLFLFFLYGEGLFLIFVLVIAAVAATAYNKKIKPKKRAARVALEHQLSVFRDLEAMQHFMAVYVDRGTCVFYHPFRSARIQADLISGFISAVTSVYGEISGEEGVQGTLEEIHYQGLRLNSYSGRYVLGILILEKEISPLLRDRLQFFIDMFENEYESHLDGWTGIIDCFDPEWIVSNLMATFGYNWVVPHTIDDSVKMNGTEKRIIGYINASLGEKMEREFIISEYLQPIASMLKKSQAEILDIFMKMDEKGIIQSISVHSILLRQGLGLSGVDELVEEFAEVEEVVLEEPPEVPEPEEEPESPEVAPEPIPEEPAETIEGEPEESEPEPEEEEDPREQFLADVESLLKKEKEENGDDNS